MRLPRRRAVVRWVLGLVIVAVVLLYGVLPLGVGIYATRPLHEAGGEPPTGYQAVRFETDDGLTLAGWYAPPRNGAVIVVVHGGGGSKRDVRSYAAMLDAHDFGVLALDLSGFGESEGGGNRFGWEGTRDVGAALGFLATQPEVVSIGGLGVSLGGEVLLGAASTYPQLKAIVADGASNRSYGEYISLPKNRTLVRNFTARLAFGWVMLFSGQPPPMPLLESMMDTTDTQYLLVAGGKNGEEVEFNKYFYEQVGSDHATLWVVSDVGHTRAFGTYPDEYEARVVAFLTAALVGK